MKKQKYRIRYWLICLTGLMTFACYDNEPSVENLPVPDVAFTYEIVDNSYQLDYYVGATVKFTGISTIASEFVWDFGDGSGTVTGNPVEHKYTLAGSYSVKLTIADTKSKTQPIMIKDIVPIMSVDPIEDGICEVLNTPVTISVEIPNPENLSVDYLWLFPEGTKDKDGNKIVTYEGENPGELIFSHVGSQAVRLQVKLGGRSLEDGKVNVQVGYYEEVPTLYYAVKGGNIMALKLVENKPAGMNIYPFDMGISAGKRALNILFNDPSLYILDCGERFTWYDDTDGNMGDGKITIMSKDGKKYETMLSNVGGPHFDDPYYGCIEGTYLYFADRLTGIARIPLTDRNKIFSRSAFPFYVQGATLGYYSKGMGYASLNAGIGKINGVWYWSKTNTGTGIFRFRDSDILDYWNGSGTAPAPEAGIVLAATDAKSFAWDSKNEKFYFSLYTPSREGLYGCTIAQLDAIGDVTEAKIAPYRLKTANGKTVTPITESGKGEGGTGEFIGICQLAVDEATGCVYFGLRSAIPEDVKTGLLRYNPARNIIEPVIEGVEVYGVAVNNIKSKLF